MGVACVVACNVVRCCEVFWIVVRCCMECYECCIGTLHRNLALNVFWKELDSKQ